MIKQKLLHIKSVLKHLVVLLLCVMVSTCERDDICPEDVPTTPRLILEFFDTTNQDNLKAVPSLFIQGVGNENPLPGFTGGTGINKVELPLKTDDNSTSFSFIKSYAVNDNGTPNDTSDDFVTGNEDIITVTYDVENVYVSRACGFKTIYNNVLINVDLSDTDRWIDLIQSVNDNQSVEDETTTHFNFFHD